MFLWWLVSFAFAFVACWVGAEATIAESRLKSTKAAMLTGILEVLGLVDWILAVKVSLWLGIPAVAGAMIGTWFGVERRKRMMLKRRLEKHLNGN